MGDVVGIALTALVGVAGILSTHLLARQQRSSERVRFEKERRESYRFARFETQAALCAEFMGELRTLEVAIWMRDKLTGETRRTFREVLVEIKRRTEPTTPELAENMRALDEQIKGALPLPSEDRLPPRVEEAPAIRRIAELAARLQVVGGQIVADAAKGAELAAIATLMDLGSSKLADLAEPLSLEDLRRSIRQFEIASLYELRMVPDGYQGSFADLIERARRESEQSDGAQQDSK